MTTPDATLAMLRQLFTHQKLAVLSTQKGGQPYASLVAYYSGNLIRDRYAA